MRLMALLLGLMGAAPDLAAATPGATEEGPSVSPAAWHAALELLAGSSEAAGVPALVRRARADVLIGALGPARDALVEASRLVQHPDPHIMRLLAMVEYARGDYVAAGLLFAAAADRLGQVLGGVLEGRAGDAFERAGLERRARQHYRRAALRLPEAAGWLATREARLDRDTAIVAGLLRRTGAAEQRMAAQVWADALLRLGDTARAVTAREHGGQAMAAADMALAARGPPGGGGPGGFRV